MSCTVTITATPMPDAPADVVACNSYTLPNNLTVGNYFSQTGGVGPIDVSIPITTSQTIYVYAISGTCWAENPFTVTINTIDADEFSDVTVCESYTLPNGLSANNSYYTSTGGPTGSGTMLNEGDVINSTQTIYVYAETGTTPNCIDESSFTVTIVDRPTAQQLQDVEVCQGTPFVLQGLDPGNYYYTATGGPLGTGTMLNAGAVISSTQTIYIYATNDITLNTCWDEKNFTVTVIDSPVVELSGGCVDNVYKISATVTTGESVIYVWSDESGVISGASGSTINVNQDGTYSCMVKLSSGQLCESETVFFLANGTLCQIQKGISPNGDGLNDNFDLTGLNVKKLEIFNRYGRKVYSYSNYVDQWYGQSDKGDELPTGTYYFVIERDNVEAKSGWIYINRQ
jgi:gliding motility-associated-like protein